MRSDLIGAEGAAGVRPSLPPRTVTGLDRSGLNFWALHCRRADRRAERQIHDAVCASLAGLGRGKDKNLRSIPFRFAPLLRFLQLAQLFPGVRDMHERRGLRTGVVFNLPGIALRSLLSSSSSVSLRGDIRARARLPAPPVARVHLAQAATAQIQRARLREADLRKAPRPCHPSSVDLEGE